jgi:nucleoside-diphosphate-sugar epimerase
MTGLVDFRFVRHNLEAKMRILVIGGTRFIGKATVERLAAAGHELLVFHRGGTGAATPPEGVRELLGDRKNLADFRDEFRQFAPDAAVDCIAMTEESAKSTFETLRGIARRAVVLSSADVYRAYDRLRKVDFGPPDPVPLSEDAPLRDRLFPYQDPEKAPDEFMNRYDKILVERVALSDPELPGTVLRLPMVYGPFDGQRRLFPYLKRMDDGRPAILLSETAAAWRDCRGYVENVAEAVRLCLTNDAAAGRIYNFNDAEDRTEVDWIRYVAEGAGWAGEIKVWPEDRLPAHLQEEIDFTHHFILDTSRIREELGYAEVIPSEEAMRRAVEWERANPPAQFDPASFDYDAEDAALQAMG